MATISLCRSRRFCAVETFSEHLALASTDTVAELGYSTHRTLCCEMHHRLPIDLVNHCKDHTHTRSRTQHRQSRNGRYMWQFHSAVIDDHGSMITIASTSRLNRFVSRPEFSHFECFHRPWPDNIWVCLIGYPPQHDNESVDLGILYFQAKQSYG